MFLEGVQTAGGERERRKAAMFAGIRAAEQMRAVQGGSRSDETTAKHTNVRRRLQVSTRGGTYSRRRDGKSGRTTAGTATIETSETGATAAIPLRRQAATQLQQLQRRRRRNYWQRMSNSYSIQLILTE